jgi:hypothetical protein
VRRFALVSLPLCACALAALALAQDQVPEDSVQQGRPVGSYAGVAPGSGNLPPRAPSQPATAQLMTWPGFQARPDGASRFFLQTTQPVVHDVQRQNRRVVITLRNTQLHLRNNRRTLETLYFNTPVSRMRIQRRGRDLTFVLDLRADVAPSVSTQTGENGYHYLFVEFPSGEFLPERLRTETVEQSPRDVGPGDTLDNERPPDM